jgi:hypothetical protein
VIKRQTPSITVTVRVPAHVFEQLERKLTIMRENGINVSKNSLFVEALKKYLESSELKDKGNEQEKNLMSSSERKSPEILEESCEFCDRRYSEIKADIENNNFDEGILTNACCWKTICRINSQLKLNVDWRELCRRRGEQFKEFRKI